MLFVNKVRPKLISKRAPTRFTATMLLGCSVGYFFALAVSAPQPDSVNVLFRLHGSNTIGAELGPALAEAFPRQRGATDIPYQPSGEAEKDIEIGTLPGQTAAIAIEIQAKVSATGVTKLTVEQVRKTFSQIQNWQEVGGSPGGIQVHSRPQSTSGTYGTFDNLVLKPAKL